MTEHEEEYFCTLELRLQSKVNEKVSTLILHCKIIDTVTFVALLFPCIDN